MKIISAVCATIAGFFMGYGIVQVWQDYKDFMDRR